MNSIIKEYLTQRFLINNIRKYHKYCLEWIDGLIPDQIRYFVEEKKRLNL